MVGGDACISGGDVKGLSRESVMDLFISNTIRSLYLLDLVFYPDPLEALLVLPILARLDFSIQS